jgi:hypothetical protein
VNHRQAKKLAHDSAAGVSPIFWLRIQRRELKGFGRAKILELIQTETIVLVNAIFLVGQPLALIQTDP